jgi:hypothetical protein
MVSIPPPAFIFDGDTFAVPSWEFRCTLPQIITVGELGIETAPTTDVEIFGIGWHVYRAYSRTRANGVIFVAPDGNALALRADGASADTSQSFSEPNVQRRVLLRTMLTADEFMHALKAIAERNAV